MGRVAEKFDSFADWLSGAGLGVSWFERVVYWWKHFGLVKMLGVAVAVFLPLWKYQLFPMLCTRAADDVAEAYNVQIDVRDWDTTLIDLAATAEGVRVKPLGESGPNDLLRADTMRVDASLWRWLTTGRMVSEIVVERPTIYLERQLSGRWNWEALFDSGAIRAGRDGSIELASLPGAAKKVDVRAPRIVLTEARLQWVENVPGGSGAGRVQSTKAAVYFDDMEVRLSNVFFPPRADDPPFSFQLEARIADGRIAINGRRKRASEAAAAGFYKVRTRGAEPETAASIVLDNVGAGAIATVVHRARLVPRSGVVNGHIDLVWRRDAVECLSNLELQGVQYAADFADDPGLKRREQTVKNMLTELRIDGRVVANCAGNPQDPEYRVPDAIQYAITKEAMREAPPVVRAVAVLDARQIETPNEQITGDELTAELRALGVSDEVSARVEQAGMITRGVRRVKEGWRRITR